MAGCIHPSSPPHTRSLISDEARRREAGLCFAGRAKNRAEHRAGHVGGASSAAMGGKQSRIDWAPVMAEMCESTGEDPGDKKIPKDARNMQPGPYSCRAAPCVAAPRQLFTLHPPRTTRQASCPARAARLTACPPAHLAAAPALRPLVAVSAR